MRFGEALVAAVGRVNVGGSESTGSWRWSVGRRVGEAVWNAVWNNHGESVDPVKTATRMPCCVVWLVSFSFSFKFICDCIL